MTLLLSLFACEHGLTLPSLMGSEQEGPLEAGLKLEIRERRHLLPGYDSSPPPPEYAVSWGSCDDLENGGPRRGPDCASGTITCGETIIGHTLGGEERYDTRFYARSFCTPATSDHDGGDERIYQLKMPEGENKAFVYLDTPCADLDMAAIRFNEDTCPVAGSSLITNCEMFPKKNTNREVIEIVSQGPSTWWLVVEGKDQEEGIFAIHVQCRAGLQ